MSFGHRIGLFTGQAVQPQLRVSAMVDVLAEQIATAWNGRNAYQVAAQFGLPARCVYTALLSLHAERNWLLSLQQAGVAHSAAQSARLALLLDLIAEDHPPQDRAFRTAAQTPPVGEGLQCFCRAQPGGSSQSTSQGPQQ